jgi:pimeloyl-ACP methyl ester carboxylesterase
MRATESHPESAMASIRIALPALFALTALTALAHASSLDLAGVARVDVPAGLFEEARLSICAASPTGLNLRPGERVLAGVKVTGRVPLASERAALTEAQVTFAAASRSPYRTVVVRTRALAVRLAGYEPRAHVEDGRVVAPVPLPTWLSGPVELFLVDYSGSVEQVTSAELVEDPHDTEPLGTRRPLVFIHGKDNHDLTETYHHEAKLAPFAKLRPAAPRNLYKPYFYMYPSYRSTAENGRALVSAVRSKLGDLPADRLVAVAHSMGGLVLRHAMATGDFARTVGLAVTTSSPHHGALAASLLFANARLSERLGALGTLVLRYGGQGEPDTPGLKSLAWDNFDGGITPEEEARYGVRVNRELAAFNASWPHGERLVVMMGDVRTLLGGSQFFGVKNELYRLTQAAWAPRYGNADPMVYFASGVFEGAAVRERVVFTDFDHEEIMGHPKAVAALVRRLVGHAVAD